MRTLHLYHGDAATHFDFDPEQLATKKGNYLAAAKVAAEKIIGGALEGAALSTFEGNVERWMARGFHGHFSLESALATPGEATPKTKLIDVRTVGHEVELGTLGLRRADLAYGAELAATAGRAPERVLASGKPTERDSRWPLMKITADGVSESAPGKGHVEIVFGPVAVDDHAELTRRGLATQLFIRAAREQAYFGKPPVERAPRTLSEVVGRYNILLGRADDRAAMAKYKLTVSTEADVVVPALPTPSVQTNLEIPLRKLGDVHDTTVPALFGVKESADRDMFLAARAEASRIVDERLRPTAAELHGGRYREDSIKLDKLRGALTLTLLYMGKVDQFAKEHWPFLPKTGAADVVRAALNVRDKLALFHHTQDPTRRGELYDDLVRGAQAVHAAGGGGPGEDLASPMRELADSLLTPGNRRERYGDEDACYGTVVNPKKQASGTGSSTGKKLAVGMDYTQKMLAGREPKIVVELRRSDNPMNSGFEHLAQHEPQGRKVAKTPLDQQPSHRALVAAAAHGGPRAAKVEVE